VSRLVAVPPRNGHRSELRRASLRWRTTAVFRIALRIMLRIKKRLRRRSSSPRWRWDAWWERRRPEMGAPSRFSADCFRRGRFDSLNSELRWMCGSLRMMKRTRRFSSATPQSPRWLQLTASRKTFNDDWQQSGITMRDWERQREIGELGDSREALGLQCDGQGRVIGRDKDKFFSSLSASSEMRWWQRLGFGHEY
jgi:hypothetical protein